MFFLPLPLLLFVGLLTHYAPSRATLAGAEVDRLTIHIGVGQLAWRLSISPCASELGGASHKMWTTSRLCDLNLLSSTLSLLFLRLNFGTKQRITVGFRHCWYCI